MIVGYLTYKSALVPPQMALLRLIGGPVLVLNFALILSSAYKKDAGPCGLRTLPEAAWELSLGIYCAWLGFRSGPVAKGAAVMSEPVPA